MADSIKINKLEIENVKRIKAVKIEPTKNGLTIVGGNNNQGRVSTGDECSIIIEDGYVVKDLEAGKAEAPAAPTWKAGVF